LRLFVALKGLDVGLLDTVALEGEVKQAAAGAAFDGSLLFGGQFAGLREVFDLHVRLLVREGELKNLRLGFERFVCCSSLLLRPHREPFKEKHDASGNGVWEQMS
jgi:hypothetical protein